MNKLFCKLTGGHRFKGEPATFIDKNEIVHFYHKCIKCGSIEEFTVPWICLWRAGNAENLKKE